jgi:hypothetical protein
LQTIHQKFFITDTNSPEGAGIINTTAARPEGSLVTYHYNLNNFSHFNKSLIHYAQEAEGNILQVQKSKYL